MCVIHTQYNVLEWTRDDLGECCPGLSDHLVRGKRSFVTLGHYPFRLALVRRSYHPDQKYRRV